jgi:mannose-1-phosphate guanylyltransferase
MNQSVYAVIMAGGIGSRFWPLSRLERPKQFLKVFGENSLIEDTLERLRPSIPAERLLVITSALHEERTRHLFPWLPPENIIGEPVGRNTAACAGLAALLVHKRDPNARIILLPADHYIGDNEEFLCTLERAAEACVGGHLVTLGIPPNRPETGYGYIQHEAESLSPGVHTVRTFAEKPNAQTALRFLKSGDFLWNAGIFIWEVQTIIQALETWAPELWDPLSSLTPSLGGPGQREALENVYPMVKSVSIDYAVMEHAASRHGLVRVIKATFPWNDVGTWAEVHRMQDHDDDGNSVQGDAVLVQSQGCHVHSNYRLTALVGMKNTIVVDSPDAILVCRMDKDQDVREVINRLKEDGLHELL